MVLSNEGIVVILFVGLIAGWLAGKIVRGTGFGIIGDIIVGIAGAFISSLARHPSRRGYRIRDHLFGDRRGPAVAGRAAASRPSLTPVAFVRLRMGPPIRTAPFEFSRLQIFQIWSRYSTTSTIRWVRGSTRTVRPFTTV